MIMEYDQSKKTATHPDKDGNFILHHVFSFYRTNGEKHPRKPCFIIEDKIDADCRLTQLKQMMEIAECLIKHGADINARNSQGQTPLDGLLTTFTEDLKIPESSFILEFMNAKGAKTGKRKQPF